MAHDLPEVAEMLADKLDLSPAQVTDLADATPLLNHLWMIPSTDGTTHKYTKESGAPVVGFRADNAGRDMDHGIDTLVFVTLKILDWTFEVDKAVADSWMKGAGPYVTREGFRHLRAALKAFETQIIYGDQAPGDTAGFVGLADWSYLSELGEGALDAGDSTVSQCSSVYALRLGVDDVVGIYRGDRFVEMGEPYSVNKALDGDGKNFPSYYRPACTWLGLQVGSIDSVRRLANLGPVSNTLNDDALSKLVESFPEGKGPTHLVMSRRSRAQLQRSRTAYSETGEPVPTPTDYDGLPIVCTDSILDTEAVVS